MPMDKQKLRETVQKFKDLIKLHQRANRTMAKLITHPEATDEQILYVCHQRRDAAIRLRQTGEVLRKTLCENPDANYMLGGEHQSEVIGRLIRDEL